MDKWCMITGRFQPFHVGHLNALYKAREFFESIIIGIIHPWKPDDMFTQEEVKKMIELVKNNRRELNIKKIIIIPKEILELDNDGSIIRFEKTDYYKLFFADNKRIIHFVPVTEKWDVKKTINEIFEGIPIFYYPFKQDVSGSSIRKMIISGNETWVNYVPDEIVNFLRHIVSKKTLNRIELRDNHNKRIYKKLRGINANSGTVRGKAFVIKNIEEIIENMDKIEENSILVCPYTIPILAPALIKIKGLVTETGGITSHAAIIAREIGIPCVVGVENITEIIKTGDLIEIRDGEVIVYEKSNSS